MKSTVSAIKIIIKSTIIWNPYYFYLLCYKFLMISYNSISQTLLEFEIYFNANKNNFLLWIYIRILMINFMLIVLFTFDKRAEG